MGLNPGGLIRIRKRLNPQLRPLGTQRNLRFHYGCLRGGFLPTLHTSGTNVPFDPLRRELKPQFVHKNSQPKAFQTGAPYQYSIYIALKDTLRQAQGERERLVYLRKSDVDVK
jgi:hypothetical protein